jgi:hypothetical protein
MRPEAADSHFAARSLILPPPADNLRRSRQTIGREPHAPQPHPLRGKVVLDLAPLGWFHLAERVDPFWTTLNYHDLHVPKYADVDMAAFNKLVFDSLKPGGSYFIVDHAAAAGTGATLSSTLHRIEEATVVQEVTAAGLRQPQALRVRVASQNCHIASLFSRGPELPACADQLLCGRKR